MAANAPMDPFDIPEAPVLDADAPPPDPFDQPERDFSGIGEFDARRASEKDKWRLALGYLTTPTLQARADIIKTVLPDAKIEIDRNTGRHVVTYRGETGYIDKPGVTLGGLLDTVAQVGKFLPAGKIASLGGGLLSKVGLAAAGGAATSVAEDVAAIPQGSQQGVDIEKAAITAAGAGAGQAVSGPISRGVGWLANKGQNVWRALRGNPIYIEGGRLTEQGRRLAMQAGLNPDELTDDLIAELESAARVAVTADVPPAQRGIATERQALSQRFGVPLTKGEVTGDYAQQSLEENLRRMDVTTKAGRIMRGAETDSAKKMLGDSGETGFGKLAREINPRPAAGVSGAGQEVLGATQQSAEAAKGAYQSAYGAARESGAALASRPYRDFLGRVKSVLVDQVDYDENLMPQTKTMLAYLEKHQIGMEEMGRAAPRKIPLTKLENIRKNIVAAGKKADPTDQRGLAVLKSQFDQMVDDALEQGQIIGSPEAVSSWKSGRALFARFQELYAEGRGRGMAEKRAGKTVANWLESDAVTGDEVIAQAIRNKALTARILKIHGENSPAHLALKQGVLEHVFRPAVKNDAISARLIVSNYKRFFQGASKEQMEAIFGPEDLKAIREFVRLAEAKIPAEGVVNYSNTGNVLMKSVQQLGQKLGLIGAASGNMETAAAFGLIETVTGTRASSQAAEAARGLVPVSRVGPAAVAGAGAGAAGLSDAQERRPR